MIEDALRYQTQGDDWVTRTLIGGGILTLGLLFSFLILPLAALFTFNGYMLEVMRRVMDGEKTVPPEWGDLDLAATTLWGLKHAVIVFVFTMVVFLVAGIPFALFVGVGAAADAGGLSLLGVLIGGVIYLAGTLVLAAVLPVATGNFVRTGSIGGGFDIGVLRTVVPNRRMLMAVLYAFAVNILLSVVANVLGFTIIGYLAVPFVAFVAQSAIFYIWGEGFADAYEEEYRERPTVPDGPLKSGVTVGGDGAAGSGSVTGTGVDAPADGTGGSDWNDTNTAGETDDDRRWE